MQQRLVEPLRLWQSVWIDHMTLFNTLQRAMDCIF